MAFIQRFQIAFHQHYLTSGKIVQAMETEQTPQAVTEM